jgi:aerobic-type carbon monoxide dehydrogenase small subunit (CoxS/CutS family)
MQVEFDLNGQSVSADVEPRTTLADCIRGNFGQTGTHLACEHGVCGACTVLVNGEAVRSCLLLAVQVQGDKIVTVEGLSGAELTPLQAAFRKHHALQCGFCTPGFITTAHAVLTRVRERSDESVQFLYRAPNGACRGSAHGARQRNVCC